MKDCFMLEFLMRWLAALALVLATYNPTQYNYIYWASENASGRLPLVVLVGLFLLIGYIIYVRATFRSIGPIGVVLVAAVIAALVWVLVDYGIISLEDPGAITWISLVGLSFILGIGLSWSHVRRRLAGQADVDDVDE
jgi:Family of unknown function (DUF6524)